MLCWHIVCYLCFQGASCPHHHWSWRKVFLFLQLWWGFIHRIWYVQYSLLLISYRYITYNFILSAERDLVGLDAETSRLVFLASISDFDDTVSMPRRLLWKHPHISMFSQLTDASLYIIRKWVINYLAYEKWVYRDIPFNHYSSNDYISALGFLGTMNAVNWVTEIKRPVSNITPIFSLSLSLSLPPSPLLSLHYLFYEEMH